jgi:hypothetical protein
LANLIPTENQHEEGFDIDEYLWSYGRAAVFTVVSVSCVQDEKPMP